MDDLIVLILTLIFIIAGVFGQMKKRKLPPETADQAQPGEDNFWESLEYEDEEKEPVGVTEHLKPVKEVVREDRFHTPGNTMRREFARDLTELVPASDKVKVAKKKSFPLKKAVIYSEILHRKYF